MNKAIRWQQRFQNFEKAFSQLGASIKIAEPSEVERAGLIQFFEVSFELAWKTLKDYLEADGFLVNSPRETIKQAFQANLIEKGHEWIEGLEDRNLTTHTYEEAIARKAEKLIREKYYPLLKELVKTLHKRQSSP